MKFRAILILILLSLFSLTACSIIENIAPPTGDSEAPTQAVEEPTPTPEPTLGEPEYISAVYCWESHIDDGEYNLIRFFPSGNLIDIYAQPYTSCEDAWAGTGEYLVEENLRQFNHGTYHLSGTWIVFELIPPNSDEVAGEVNGEYSVETMRLNRVGSDPRDYILLNIGE